MQIIGTGEAVARPWYATTCSAAVMDNNSKLTSQTGEATTASATGPTSTLGSAPPAPSPSKNVRGKFAPDTLKVEPGAVLCRVSRSFLRFGQLELFALRREFEELQQLADYVCFREYPHLLRDSPAINSSSGSKENNKESGIEGEGTFDLFEFTILLQRTQCFVVDYYHS